MNGTTYVGHTLVRFVWTDWAMWLFWSGIFWLVAAIALSERFSGEGELDRRVWALALVYAVFTVVRLAATVEVVR